MEAVQSPASIHFDPERIQSALTSTFRELIFLTPQSTPPTLFRALVDHFPHIDPNSWSSRIAEGGLFLNGVVTVTDVPLHSPCRIEYFEPKATEDLLWRDLSKNPAQLVAFEDEEIIVFFKPAGLASMPTREQRTRNLKSLLDRYIRANDPTCSLHMPSRIDTSVSGLVLSSKRASMHRALQRIFERREVCKTYLLGTTSPIGWNAFHATGPIDRDPRHPILRRVVASGGKPALTIFTRIRSEPQHALLAASPVTGRTHQIRVHAASYGFPIRGDNFYDGAPAPVLELMSARVRFTHPHRHQELVVHVPHELVPAWVPKDLALETLPTTPAQTPRGDSSEGVLGRGTTR